MKNLKECNGTYKGLIGECMFKLKQKNAVINKYWNKRKYFEIFGQHLTNKQMEFLNDYWHSLDAVEINFKIGQKKKVIYEIKTINAYKRRQYLKPKINHSSILLYQKALSLGFEVQLAYVCLHEDWKFSIEFVEFSKDNCYVNWTKTYDKEILDFI